jgi:hypothetical protein
MSERLLVLMLRFFLRAVTSDKSCEQWERKPSQAQEHRSRIPLSADNDGRNPASPSFRLENRVWFGCAGNRAATAVRGRAQSALPASPSASPSPGVVPGPHH